MPARPDRGPAWRALSCSVMRFGVVQPAMQRRYSAILCGFALMLTALLIVIMVVVVGRRWQGNGVDAGIGQ
jgi:hypothetical protein